MPAPEDLSQPLVVGAVEYIPRRRLPTIFVAFCTLATTLIVCHAAFYKGRPDPFAKHATEQESMHADATSHSESSAIAVVFSQRGDEHNSSGGGGGSPVLIWIIMGMVMGLEAGALWLMVIYPQWQAFRQEQARKAAEEKERNTVTLQVRKVEFCSVYCELVDKRNQIRAHTKFEKPSEGIVKQFWAKITPQCKEIKRKYINIRSQDGELLTLTDDMLKDELERHFANPHAMSPTEVVRMVSGHSTERNCWVIINGQVYDLTDYLASKKHPQGNSSITPWAGKDVSEEFNLVHPATALSTLPPSALLGDVQARVK